LLFVCLASCGQQGIVRAAELRVSPERVLLSGPFSCQQLLARLGDNDATSRARYKSTNPDVASVDPHGFVTPRAAGTATVEVAMDDAVVLVPVEVVTSQAEPS